MPVSTTAVVTTIVMTAIAAGPIAGRTRTVIAASRRVALLVLLVLLLFLLLVLLLLLLLVLLRVLLLLLLMLLFLLVLLFLVLLLRVLLLLLLDLLLLLLVLLVLLQVLLLLLLLRLALIYERTSRVGARLARPRSGTIAMRVGQRVRMRDLRPRRFHLRSWACRFRPAKAVLSAEHLRVLQSCFNLLPDLVQDSERGL